MRHLIRNNLKANSKKKKTKFRRPPHLSIGNFTGARFGRDWWGNFWTIRDLMLVGEPVWMVLIALRYFIVGVVLLRHTGNSVVVFVRFWNFGGVGTYWRPGNSFHLYWVKPLFKKINKINTFPLSRTKTQIPRAKVIKIIPHKIIGSRNLYIWDTSEWWEGNWRSNQRLFGSGWMVMKNHEARIWNSVISHKMVVDSQK